MINPYYIYIKDVLGVTFFLSYRRYENQNSISIRALHLIIPIINSNTSWWFYIHLECIVWLVQMFIKFNLKTFLTYWISLMRWGEWRLPCPSPRSGLPTLGRGTGLSAWCCVPGHAWLPQKLVKEGHLGWRTLSKH